jgi:hypothetical protein
LNFGFAWSASWWMGFLCIERLSEKAAKMIIFV